MPAVALILNCNIRNSTRCTNTKISDMGETQNAKSYLLHLAAEAVPYATILVSGCNG